MDGDATGMAREAAEAAAVVRRQVGTNRAVAEQIGERLRARRPSAVVTSARGSSDHAATFLKYLVETRAGVLVSSAAPSVSSVYGHAPDFGGTLTIALSQSGQSPDIVAPIAAARGAGAETVAMVNVVDSPVADAAETVMPLHAGRERSVAATKSFIGALAATIQLTAAWTEDARMADALAAAPDLLDEAAAADWAPMVEQLRAARGLYVIGRGLGYGIAQEAALKFKETCGIHAEAFSAAEVRHGPMAIVDKQFPLLIFRQDDEAAEGIDRLVGDMTARGGTVLLAGGRVPGAISLPTPAAHPAIEPMLRIASFYRAAAALSVVRGLDPDRPPHLAKVTETV